MYFSRDENGTYCTRLPVPKDLTILLGFPPRVHLSLCTKDRQVAVSRHLEICGKVQETYRQLADGEIQLTSDEFRLKIAGLAGDIRGVYVPPQEKTPPKTVEPDKPDTPKASAEPIRIRLEDVQLPEKRVYFRKNARRRPGRPHSEPSLAPDSIKTCIDEFLTTKRAEKVSERSCDQMFSALMLFARAIGVHHPISAVTPPVAMQYRSVLLQTSYAHKTIKGFLAVTSQFLNWCIAMGYVVHNPFSHMKLPRRVHNSVRDERPKWRSEDLEKLVNSEWFREASRKRPDWYWIPMIMLHAGLRTGECCQLRVDDIREEDGVLCICVADDGPGQRLKTAAARRFVPVHQTLLELGLDRLITHRREQGAVQLFDYTPCGAYGEWSDGFSQLFGRVLARLGFERGPRSLSAYGVRHTFIDAMQAAEVAENVAAELAGHAKQGLTYGRYAKRVPILVLAAAVAKVAYEVTIAPWQGPLDVVPSRKKKRRLERRQASRQMEGGSA